MQPDMNESIRRAGNRSRAVIPAMPGSLPNIGQTPAVQAANAVMGELGPGRRVGQYREQGLEAPTPPGQMGRMPGMPPQAQASPMAAPPVQPQTAMFHPPGAPADPNSYNYEPQPNGAWLVYPPGVQAPPHLAQASLPRAASTADYRRMRQAFLQVATPPPGAAVAQGAPTPAPAPGMGMPIEYRPV